MAEYIDKEQVQTELMMSAERYTIAHESGGFGTVEWSDNLIPVSKAMEIIRNMPSIEDVPVVHGRWDKGTDSCWHICEECGAEVDISMGTGVWVEGVELHELNYCPNCGARMDGEV